MKQKRSLLLRFAFSLLLMPLSIYIFFLGLKDLTTILFTSLDGVQTKGKLINREDDEGRCKYITDENRKCSYIVAKYKATNNNEYILEDKVYKSAIIENEIIIIYNPTFPFLAYFNSNLGNIIAWMVFYLFVGQLSLQMIYAEIRRLIRRWNKVKRSVKS